MQNRTKNAMASQEEGEEKVVQYKAEAKKLETKEDSENPLIFLARVHIILNNAHHLIPQLLIC